MNVKDMDFETMQKEYLRRKEENDLNVKRERIISEVTKVLNSKLGNKKKEGHSYTVTITDCKDASYNISLKL